MYRRWDTNAYPLSKCNKCYRFVMLLSDSTLGFERNKIFWVQMKFYLFFFGGNGFWTQGFTLARQARHHLSHSTIPEILPLVPLLLTLPKRSPLSWNLLITYQRFHFCKSTENGGRMREWEKGRQRDRCRETDTDRNRCVGGWGSHMLKTREGKESWERWTTEQRVGDDKPLGTCLMGKSEVTEG
jgi:hypothetical protein